jgi:hypothetical protein
MCAFPLGVTNPGDVTVLDVTDRVAVRFSAVTSPPWAAQDCRTPPLPSFTSAQAGRRSTAQNIASVPCR